MGDQEVEETCSNRNKSWSFAQFLTMSWCSDLESVRLKEWSRLQEEKLKHNKWFLSSFSKEPMAIQSCNHTMGKGKYVHFLSIVGQMLLLLGRSMGPLLVWRPDINPYSMMYNWTAYTIVKLFLSFWGKSCHSEIKQIETSGQEIEFKLILNPGKISRDYCHP